MIIKYYHVTGFYDGTDYIEYDDTLKKITIVSKNGFRTTKCPWNVEELEYFVKK